MESEKEFRPPKYVVLTMGEITRLIICIIFDLVEFAVPFLLSPLVGDTIDIMGFWTGILMFRWIGCLTILELVPYADYFPVFVFTWVVWYYRKKRKDRTELAKLRKKWK